MKKEVLIKNNDKVSKYLIEYDFEKLNKLRKEICINCGFRRHIHDKKVYFNYNKKDDFLIENYKSKNVGTKDYDYGSKDIYEIEYDIITEPKLSLMIKDFLDNKESDIFNLLINDNIIIEENNIFDDLIMSLKKQSLKYLEEDNIEKLKLIINDLENLVNDKIKNEKLNLDNQNNYVLKLKSLIKINKIDEMSIIEYNKFINFTDKIKVLEFK